MPVHNRIDLIRSDAPELAAYGQSAIGVRTLKFVNPDQIDLLQVDPNAPASAPLPTGDRRLTVEVWYPARTESRGRTALKALMRDGRTEVTLRGRAVRDAAPAAGDPAFPLVIVSHGFPGNRFLLSPLAENIASKGYVVASIDHTDSTYDDLGPRSFASTLVNRPLDQLFVLDSMARLAADPSSFLHARIDADRSAVIGYSMGGYGALITAGAGVTQQAVDGLESPFSAPQGTLAVHRLGSPAQAARFDPRLKTVLAIAPWGSSRGFFDTASLGAIRVPLLLMAGSADDICGYENGIRATWQGAAGVDRALLTFENANHNAAGPMPAPFEAHRIDPATGSCCANHYIDAVWDNVRMNNIAQHFATAWLGRHLQGDAGMDDYLRLLPSSNQAVWAMDAENRPRPEHSWWKGFPNRAAAGLRFEVLKAGNRPLKRPVDAPERTAMRWAGKA